MTHEWSVSWGTKTRLEAAVEKVAQRLVNCQIVVLRLLDGHTEDTRVQPEAGWAGPYWELQLVQIAPKAGHVA